MMTGFSPRFALLWLVVGSGLAFGQKKVEVKFASQGLPSDMPALVMAVGTKVSASFEVPSTYFSDLIEAPAREFGLRAEGTEGPDLVKVALPGDGLRFVVLLVAGEGDKVSPIVVPVVSTQFKAGDFYLHNATAETIIGQIGSTKIGLRPWQGRFFEPEGAVDEAYYNTILGIPDAADPKKIRPLTQSRWPVMKQSRYYVFFFTDSERPGKVRFRGLREEMPREED